MTEGYPDIGFQASVGSIIISLFPNGLDIESYIDRDSNRSSIENNEFIDKSDSEKMFHYFMDCEYRLRENIKSKISLIVKNSEKSRDLDEKTKKLYSDNPFYNNNEYLYNYMYLPYTPFDSFCIAATLLELSGAYHHIEPINIRPSGKAVLGRYVLVNKEDRKSWEVDGDRWRFWEGDREVYSEPEFPKGLPSALLISWSELLAGWNLPIFQPQTSSSPPPRWWKACLSLLAISDRAARDAGFVTPFASDPDIEGGNRAVQNVKFGQMSHADQGGYWVKFATALMEVDARMGRESSKLHTLSRACRDYACVLPKSRTAQTGATLRSLSHNLALLPPRGVVRASWVSQNQGYESVENLDRGTFNLVIIPYPFELSAQQFKPISVLKDRFRSGAFTYIPINSQKEVLRILSFLIEIINDCKERIGNIHGIVFPEMSLSALQFDEIYKFVLTHTEVELLCAGLNERYPAERRGNLAAGEIFESANEAVMVSFSRASRSPDQQRESKGKRASAMVTHGKHHRWRLSEPQIVAYDLSSVLDPSVTWWEDMRISSRKVPIMVMRDQWTVTALICEDLARVDPGQRIMRAIGPNLVLSLVMDGPQIAQRWSSMYATVLADDPGSAVLTVNSLGLIERMKLAKPGQDRDISRSIALWRDDKSSPIPIILPEGHIAACLTLSEHIVREFTIDGRDNDYKSTALRLGNYFTVPSRNL